MLPLLAFAEAAFVDGASAVARVAMKKAGQAALRGALRVGKDQLIDEGKVMAKNIVITRGNDGGRSGGSKKVRFAKAAYDAFKNAAVSVGLWEALDGLTDYAPDLVASIMKSMNDSGMSPDDLVALDSDKKRQVILVEAARLGLPLNLGAGLTGAEKAAYAKMLADFGEQLSQANDSLAAVKPELEDASIAEASYNLAMARQCARLGLTGPGRYRKLYDFAMVINSITEKDVERAELHESLYGAIRVA